MGTFDHPCVCVCSDTDRKSVFHEKQAIATAVDYLIIVGFSEAFLCVEMMTVGALSGLGRTRLCSGISIAFTSLRIPLAIILSSSALGILGIWVGAYDNDYDEGNYIYQCIFTDRTKDDRCAARTMTVVHPLKKSRRFLSDRQDENSIYPWA